MANLLFKKFGDVKSPSVGTQGSAGIDLYMPEDEWVDPFTKRLIDLKIGFEIPVGYVGILSQRSSSGKIDVSLANTVGWIDSDYRDSVKVFVKYVPTWTGDMCQSNVTHPALLLKKDERYFQLVIVPFYMAPLMEVQNLAPSNRAGGFGSTGQE
jgi:deoxyuridine 5'-triphosphate nucleotidohydrolase